MDGDFTVQVIAVSLEQGVRPHPDLDIQVTGWGTRHTGLTLAGQPVALTAVEYKLLQALMSAPGKAFSRDELLGHIYAHGESVVDRVVDVHIGHLRQKLSDDPATPRYIETVRGFGYRVALVPPAL